VGRFPCQRRPRLVEAYFDVALKVARGFRARLPDSRVADFDDLVGYATEGLVVEYRHLRGMSLSAIGATLAVGESLAGQIHRTAIARLRLAGDRERPGAAAI